MQYYVKYNASKFYKHFILQINKARPSFRFDCRPLPSAAASSKQQAKLKASLLPNRTSHSPNSTVAQPRIDGSQAAISLKSLSSPAALRQISPPLPLPLRTSSENFQALIALYISLCRQQRQCA